MSIFFYEVLLVANSVASVNTTVYVRVMVMVMVMVIVMVIVMVRIMGMFRAWAGTRSETYTIDLLSYSYR